MNAWWLLLGTLGYNYRRHRKGLSTICSAARGKLTWRRFVVAWGLFSAAMLWHIHDGYEP